MIPLSVELSEDDLLECVSETWDENDAFKFICKLVRKYPTRKFAEDCAEFFNSVIDIHKEVECKI